MADGVKSAGLEPVSGGPGLDLMEIAGDLIGRFHEGLVGAEIRWFWALEKPLSFWGRARVVTEETWWLSGEKLPDRADITIQVNLSLWKELTNGGRIGLIDALLAFVRRKEGGNTEMDTQDGTRLLYEVTRFSLGIDPAVIARNPKFVQEVEELRLLHGALTDPAQFLLDLQEPDEEEAGEQGSGKADLTADSGSETLYYYKQYEFDAVGRATLRFTEADRRVSSLDGVYIGNEDGSDRAALEYKTDRDTIIAFRERLDEYLGDKMIEEIKAGTVDPQEWILKDRPEDLAAEEEEPQGGEVVAMGGRRARR